MHTTRFKPQCAKRRVPQSGFTLIEIMIVVAILGIILMIAGSTWIRQRTRSQMRACQEVLSKIEGAKEQWALTTNAPNNSTPGFAALCALDGSNYIKAPVTGPVCPAGGTYSINAIGSPPTCSVEEHVMLNGTDMP